MTKSLHFWLACRSKTCEVDTRQAQSLRTIALSFVSVLYLSSLGYSYKLVRMMSVCLNVNVVHRNL